MLCHVQVAAQPSLGRGHACSVFHQFPILSGCVASGNYSRKPSRQSGRPHRTSSVSTSWSMEVMWGETCCVKCKSRHSPDLAMIIHVDRIGRHPMEPYGLWRSSEVKHGVSCASRGTAQFGPWSCLQRVSSVSYSIRMCSVGEL